MPFHSEKQRRFMWSQHPDIARRWTDEYGSKIVPSKPKAVSRRTALLHSMKKDR